MGDRIKFSDLKDEDNLIYFLKRVWKAGCMTGLINKNTSYHDLEEKFMPNFKKELSE